MCWIVKTNTLFTSFTWYIQNGHLQLPNTVVFRLEIVTNLQLISSKDFVTVCTFTESKMILNVSKEMVDLRIQTENCSVWYLMCKLTAYSVKKKLCKRTEKLSLEPFPQFFYCNLKVAFSTSVFLLFHHIATQIWRPIWKNAKRLFE